MSAYSEPTRDQSIFNPNNYGTAITSITSVFDDLFASKGTFTKLMIGADNVATTLNTLSSSTTSLSSSITPLTDKNNYLPKIFVIGNTSISNHFLGSQSFAAANTDYEFATFNFTIPDTIDGVQEFFFETDNIARIHSGSNNHVVVMKYALSTDNYATKNIIRYYQYETGSTNLLRGEPRVVIKDAVGDLTGSGNVSFTIKLYVRTSDTTLTLFGSQYETAKLMIFD